MVEAIILSKVMVLGTVVYLPQLVLKTWSVQLLTGWISFLMKLNAPMIKSLLIHTKILKIYVAVFLKLTRKP